MVLFTNVAPFHRFKPLGLLFKYKLYFNTILYIATFFKCRNLLKFKLFLCKPRYWSINATSNRFTHVLNVVYSVVTLRLMQQSPLPPYIVWKDSCTYRTGVVSTGFPSTSEALAPTFMVLSLHTIILIEIVIYFIHLYGFSHISSVV